ncbi:protein phosphatase 1 regulatory subunit 12A-like isoform X15 [Littorina saxatilis]|uniref:protein phosphatase 1 regulatory subunit 12A-like isoform X15 n=1 Tax=Littorina saxatilis TaxID=31220 RepID=UPI0038B4B1D8
MADEGKQVSALLRRHHQLKRWEDSETNREPGSPRPSAKKVKFQDGCVFLAACSSGDKDEVKKLLERGADINTANVDGLTALHQACIDDNLDMVEFLVEEGADVDVCDNEGWTPLHATASCGFTEIARYLLKHGANVAAVNNDGDLALDIAEDEEMENLLQKEMDTKGVDADSARREEEDCMMADANRWLQDNNIEDNIHPKTGATALHVAAAKGYINVMNVLLQAGADINARDNDGWTPLHAAVHWGQEESCQLLVEHMCDMDIKNNASHTVFDLASADKDMLKILDELKKKQASRRTTSESSPDIIHTAGHGSKRRSSVTRMSSDQKQNVITQSSEEERATLDANLSHLSTPKDEEDKPTVTTPSTQDAETERKNELNKQSSLISQPQLQDRLRLSTISTGTTTSVTTSVSDTSTDSKPADRSFEPPKRDEETETQRKARAKHARQTRRSTQGVSLEDIEKAEEVLRQGDSSKKNPATTEDTTSSTRSSLRDSQRDTTTATTTTATTTTTTSSIGSSLQNDRESRTSNLSSRDSFRDRDRDRDETSSYRRRNFEDRLEGDSSTRTSFRRPREDRDSATNNGTSDITSSYVPRSQRNALSTSDINSSSLSSSGVTRSASLRSSRFRNGETETAAEDDKKKDETKKTDSSGTEKEEKKETAAIKARRKRHERRSTGINYSPQEEEKGKENKPEDDEKDETADSSSSRLGRYSSSDVPSDSSGRNRPVSYSEYGQSRSTTNLEDYKKLWEESKEENAKLKKELEQTKKELLEAKEELDRLMKQRESRIDTTDKREKRALERKVSEYEEELKKMEALKVDNQRLKDENGALIRVISKLSK